MNLGGPYHDFWVLEETAHPPQGYLAYSGRKDAPLRIEPHLLEWFGSVLRWHPTELPWGEPFKKYQGLNWLGPTILRSNNALLLAKTATLWCEIFEAGSESVTLPIRPWFPDRSATEPVIQIDVPRTVLLAHLRSLADLAHAGSQPGFYLLHLGI